MRTMTNAELAEALARAMEPEAWERIDNGNPQDRPPEDLAAKSLASIRHATVVMCMLKKEGII